MKTRIARDVATARRAKRPIPAAGTAGWAQAETDRARIRTVLRAPPDWRAPATPSVPASATEHGAAGAPSNIVRTATRKPGRLREPEEGTGKPLPYLHQMESAFGRPFGDVEAYTGMAAELRPLGAEALTAGNVVAFADASPSLALVAHEATHVIQNRNAGAPVPMAAGVVAARDSPAEVEAGGIASLVAAHGPSVALPPIIARPTAGVQLAPSPPTPANLENTTTLDVGDGDRFQVKMVQRNNEKNHLSTLEIAIDYAGKDDQDGHLASYSIFAVLGRRPAAMLKQDTSAGWKSLEIDLYGDGTHVTKITHTVMLLPGWSPKSRKHSFQVVGPYGFHKGDELVVKSKNALPAAIAEAKPEGLPASSPVKVSDTAPGTLSSDTAVIAAKRLLDELVEHTPHSALGQLQRRISAEHAKLAGKPDDPAAATRLSRLVDAIHAVRPNMQALQLASLREAYLPDIAGDAIRMVSDVKQLYGAGLEEAYDSGAGKKMQEADQAFNAIWYRLSWLYLQSGRGVAQLVQAASFAIADVRTARDHAGRGAYYWRAIESQLGVKGTGEVGQPKVTEVNDKARQVREEYLMGTVGSLSRISEIVDNAHVIMGLSGLLAVNESFYAMKKDMDGIVGGAFDYLRRDLSKVCFSYTVRFEAILDDTEKGIRAGGNFWQLGNAATKRFLAIVHEPTFKPDLDAIVNRLKWIKAIEIIGKVLAIVAIAAFTGGAAGAAVGGALEGAGASAGVIAAGEFAAEVITFTLVSRLGNQLAFGKSDTSFGEDLLTNTLMFGFLKAAAAAYGRVFKLIADPKIYKATYAVGRAVTGMLALQAFAEVHYRVKEGKWMSGSDRARSVFQNATMLVALGLGSYLTRPLTTRLNNKILVVTAKHFPKRLEKIGAKLTDVRASLDGLAKGDPATAEKVPDLLKKIEQVWNEEISVIAEAAKRERTADAQKAFSDAVDGYVKEIARIDLQLARAGLDANLGVAGAGKLFRPFRPGFVAFKPEGKDILEAYYKESKGTFEKIKDDLYSGKVNGEETFFVPEDALKKPAPETSPPKGGAGVGHPGAPPVQDVKPPAPQPKPPVQDIKPPAPQPKPPVQDIKPPAPQPKPPAQDIKPPAPQPKPPVQDVKPPAAPTSTEPSTTTPGKKLGDFGDDNQLPHKNRRGEDVSRKTDAEIDRMSEERMEAYYRDRIDRPPKGVDPDAVRYERHRARSRRKNRKPLEKSEWDSNRQKFEERTKAGIDEEIEALADVNIQNNNKALDPTGAKRAIHEFSTMVPRRKAAAGEKAKQKLVETRPDGVTDTHYIDVKKVDPDAKRPVIDDDQQMRAERMGGKRGKGPDGKKREHAVFIVSETRNGAPVGRPSSALAAESKVYFRDQKTGEWYKWDSTKIAADGTRGDWSGPVGKSEVMRDLGATAPPTTTTAGTPSGGGSAP